MGGYFFIGRLDSEVPTQLTFFIHYRQRRMPCVDYLVADEFLIIFMKLNPKNFFFKSKIITENNFFCCRFSSQPWKMHDMQVVERVHSVINKKLSEFTLFTVKKNLVFDVSIKSFFALTAIDIVDNEFVMALNRVAMKIFCCWLRWNC